MAYNGNPTFRMWKVGTNRLLGLTGLQWGEDFIGPEIVKNNIGFGIIVFGDFIVCPFSRDKPGHMQYACIQKAENLRIEDYKEDLETPKITYLKGPFELE